MRDEKDRRSIVVSLKVNKSQKEEFFNAASRRNMNFSNYMVSLAENDIKNEYRNKDNDNGNVKGSVKNVCLTQDFINDICDTACVNNPEIRDDVNRKADELWELLK